MLGDFPFYIKDICTFNTLIYIYLKFLFNLLYPLIDVMFIYKKFLIYIIIINPIICFKYNNILNYIVYTNVFIFENG